MNSQNEFNETSNENPHYDLKTTPETVLKIFLDEISRSIYGVVAQQNYY